MRLPLILALLALSASSYADTTAPLPQGDPAQESRPEPAPQLMHLERALMQKQEARDKGELPPEKYQEFIAAFRVELEAVMGRIPPTAENKGLHAQILARLGPQEQGQALASLEQALAEDPENPALLVAKGSILYEQRDFQTADALARQAWEASGRKDPRAWALHKMSEGRISGVSSGEPAPRLKPASDFARLDWSIPERHDINEQGLDYLRQATKAFRAGDTAAAQMYTQQAMNADPTSKSMQDLYQHAQANFAKRAEIGTALEQAVAAKDAGRHQDALAWMQKAYDLFPNDQAYEALQVARQRAADAERRAAKSATVTGSDAENPPASSPYWPWPAGWGLTLLGGAWALKRKLDDENLTGPVSMMGAGVSLLAISMMFPPTAPVTTPEGVQLILAPAVAKAAVGTVGSGLTAYGVKSGFENLISRAKGNKSESEQTASSGSSPKRVSNPSKSESPFWKKLGNYRNGIKRTGNGSRTEYYKWDSTHNDIEVYDSKGYHKGSIDPTTGRYYKPAVVGRNIRSEL